MLSALQTLPGPSLSPWEEGVANAASWSVSHLPTRQQTPENKAVTTVLPCFLLASRSFLFITCQQFLLLVGKSADF